MTHHKLFHWQKLPYNPELRKNAKKLRKSGNLSEVLLWQQIKSKNLLDLNFQRQKIIGNYIVDFFCKDLKLIIEIDGLSHDSKGDYDEIRNKFLRSLGLKIIHIQDLDVKNNLQAVMEFLEIELKNIINSIY